MKINLPETEHPRVVIVGGGFAGLTLARRLARMPYQVVLLDKHNYHQFQPLLYQVAMAGLEPSSIVFPFRKLFHRHSNVFIRMTEVERVDIDQKQLHTPLGHVNYDCLVLATGVRTNFFGNESIARHAIPMKSVSQALYLRNLILSDYEESLVTTDYDKRQGLIDIVIVGGGPTGVEVAGALAEMKKYVLPKDFPELDTKEVDIHLIQSGDQLLKGMSATAGTKALQFLQQLGVTVQLNTKVTDYDGQWVHLEDGRRIRSHKVIWAAGVTGVVPDGLPDNSFAPGNRLCVDPFLAVIGTEQIYALGDIACMTSADLPWGHPQVASVAIQQARHLADNFKLHLKNKPPHPFTYKDKGSMATIGRNKAVADLPNVKFQGAFAWLIWLVVHLFSLIGTRNKVMVFLNWIWNYLTYDQTLRLIIRPYNRKVKSE